MHFLSLHFCVSLLLHFLSSLSHSSSSFHCSLPLPLLPILSHLLHNKESQSNNEGKDPSIVSLSSCTSSSIIYLVFLAKNLPKSLPTIQSLQLKDNGKQKRKKVKLKERRGEKKEKEKRRKGKRRGKGTFGFVGRGESVKSHL